MKPEQDVAIDAGSSNVGRNATASSDASSEARRDVPGPSRKAMFGSQRQALAFFRNPVAHMKRLRRDHGDFVRLVQGGNSTLFFRSKGFRSDAAEQGTYFAFSPDAIRQILTQVDLFQTRRPPGPKCEAYDRLTNNILFLNGERHKQHRKLFMQNLKRQRLMSYHQDMIDCTRRMLDGWQDGQTVDINREMGLASLNIGSKTLYGVDATAKEDSLALSMEQMLLTLLSPASMVPLNLPGTPYRRLMGQMADIVEQLEAEIQRKDDAGADGPDVLSLMLREHRADPQALTLDEMVGHAFAIFFAGHDTASKAMTWTLFLLAQHPEVMAELVAELDEHLGGEPPTYEQIYALPVLDRVVKESLRVLTPAVTFARLVTRDTTLSGYHVPAGSEVIYSPFMVHSSSEIFDQPKKFMPSRWSGIKPSAYEYLPFGAGPRMCLGASFGNLQLRVMLPMIVQRFRLEMVPDTTLDIKTQVVMGPKDGLPMVVRTPDGRFDDSRKPVHGFINEMVDLS